MFQKGLPITCLAVPTTLPLDVDYSLTRGDALDPAPVLVGLYPSVVVNTSVSEMTVFLVRTFELP